MAICMHSSGQEAAADIAHSSLGEALRLENNWGMATLPNTEELWTVRHYLGTSWSPDREFVDGHIEERNLGEKEHSILQRFLTVLFAIHRAEWGVEVLPGPQFQ